VPDPQGALRIEGRAPPAKRASMLKKRVRLVVILLAIPSILWMFTGGCVVFNYQWVSAPPYNRNYRPLLLVDVEKEYTQHGVPYLFLYSTEDVPYDMTLTYIHHDIVHEPEICFEEITLIDFNGPEVSLIDDPNGQVVIPHRDEHWYIDDNGDMQKTPCLRADLRYPACIDYPPTFDLRVKLRLYSGGREIDRIVTTVKVRSHPYTERWTTWSFLAQFQQLPD
jgi:hypothetical protein